MIALLALVAAAGWGSSDYAAGVASRRSGALAVVIVTHLTAAVVLTVASLDPLALDLGAVGGVVGRRDLGWGVLAGLCGGVGALFLFQGLAKGSMAVVAPVTAAGAAVLPAGFGLATGDPWSPLLVGGIGLALVAIVLVSLAPAAPRELDAASTVDTDAALVLRAQRAVAVIERRRARRSPAARLAPYLVGLGTSVLGGACASLIWRSIEPIESVPTLGVFLGGFGVTMLVSAGAAGTGRAPRDRSGRPAPWRAPGMPQALISGVGFALFFIVSGQVSGDAGLWPMATARSASAVLFAVSAMVVHAELLPAPGGRRVVVVAGVLDGVAAGCFLVAARSGSLSVVSVLSSLYPVATVLLACVIDKERIGRRQVVALGLAATAVSLIAIS